VQERLVRVVRTKIDSPESRSRRLCTRYDPKQSNYQLVGVRQTLQCVGEIKIGFIGPSIVPNPQFSTAWKAQWHNASLIEFADF
jgi:hypothetical protein